MHVRLVVVVLTLSLLIPQVVWSQQQTISPSQLRAAVQEAAKTRKDNLNRVRSFFTSEPVRAALKSGNIDYQRVEKAVATLSADELARLASRTSKIQSDLAAGALSNQELTYIVIALAAAVLVLVIVVA